MNYFQKLTSKIQRISPHVRNRPTPLHSSQIKLTTRSADQKRSSKVKRYERALRSPPTWPSANRYRRRRAKLSNLFSNSRQSRSNFTESRLLAPDHLSRTVKFRFRGTHRAFRRLPRSMDFVRERRTTGGNRGSPKNPPRFLVGKAARRRGWGARKQVKRKWRAGEEGRDRGECLGRALKSY